MTLTNHLEEEPISKHAVAQHKTAAEHHEHAAHHAHIAHGHSQQAIDAETEAAKAHVEQYGNK